MITRLLPIAYIAGPALLFAGTLAYVLGIGVNPNGLTSWVEGVLGAYGIALFVPIYLDLSNRLAATHRRFGTLTAITGLFGAVCGFGHEMARPFEWVLYRHGMTEATYNAFLADPGAEFLVVALLGPLFPITSVLLGLGLWRARTLPRWIAASLVAAGIGFPLAQVGGMDWALAFTYPGATLLWTVALGSIGIRECRAGSSASTARTAELQRA